MTEESTQNANLRLSPNERRLFGHLFGLADADKIGVVTGERAISFFEKTRLSTETLGEIWQIADTENRGLLTPSGFGMVLRLIGYAQNGSPVSRELGLRPGGPLPRFDDLPGLPVPQTAPIQAQTTGPIRVPPLNIEKIGQYVALFKDSGAQNGVLPGDVAKSIFEGSKLPNEALGRIWSLADKEQKGSLGATEFVIAMHLMASMKSGTLRTLPQSLPAELFEAASRRPPAAGSRATSKSTQDAVINNSKPFTSQSLPSQLTGGSAGPPVGEWLIKPQEKIHYDSIFATIDKQKLGYITGEQAVGFFSNSGLSEDVLAQVWDLSDIRSEGQLDRDEFAVAMYLIRLQRSSPAGNALPQRLPLALIPPHLRPQFGGAPPGNTSAYAPAPRAPLQPAPSQDLFDLTANSASPAVTDSTVGAAARSISPSHSAVGASQQFTQFVPSSSFGQAIMTPQNVGMSVNHSPSSLRTGPSPAKASASDDLLGDTDPEISKKFTSETNDMANLSNQVSNLTGQMQELKTKRGVANHDLSQAQIQKRQFESRLADLRAAYEQELREVRTAEDHLKTSRLEISKLGSEVAMIQGAQEDLQNQHRRINEALQLDQEENQGLKEKIRMATADIEILKPQIEKLKSEARHQKGLVAINKKQLATQELEKTKLTEQVGFAQIEKEQAAHEAENNRVDNSAPISSRGPVASSIEAGTPVASPAPSTTSMNPFFRRTMSNLNMEQSISTDHSTQATPTKNAFDSFFGPSLSSTSTSKGPPLTTFKKSTGETGSAKASRPATPEELSPNQREPPAPPQSRQITSSILPLRHVMERSGSQTSSVKVNAPASRVGDSDWDVLPSRAHSEAPSRLNEESTVEPSAALAIPTQDRERSTNSWNADSVPGAFPGDETPLEQTSFNFTANNSAVPQDFEANSANLPTPTLKHSNMIGESTKDDFDSAFDDFNTTESRPIVHKDDPFAPPPASSASEFPPIKEHEPSESGSESDDGFDDHFGIVDSQSGQQQINKGSAEKTIALPQDASLSPDAVTKAESQGFNQHDRGHEDSQLLKSSAPQSTSIADKNSRALSGRDTSIATTDGPSTSQVNKPEQERDMAWGGTSSAPVVGQNHSSMASGASNIAPFANSTPSHRENAPNLPPKLGTSDDFDFDDLSPAQEDDGGADDILRSSQFNNDMAFNPVFDTPRTNHTMAASQGSTDFATSRTSDHISSFQPSASTSGLRERSNGTAQPAAATTQNWDAIFDGLDAPLQVDGADGIGNGSNSITTKAEKPLPVPNADDDPILTRLINMGFSREASLSALEKYDYNIDKATESLLARG